MRRRWASGAKFTRRVVDRLRAEAPKGPAQGDYILCQAKIYAVHPRTIARILEGKSWQYALGKRLPIADTKHCQVCGDAFGRCWPNGRRRSDTFWAQKRTCGSSCSVKLAWQEGQYAHRGAPRALKRSSVYDWLGPWFWF